MVKSSRQRTRKGLIRSDSSRFVRTDSVVFTDDSADGLPRCAWHGCPKLPFMDIPVCLIHGFMVSDYVMEIVRSQEREDHGTSPPPVTSPPTRQAWVYYLMIGPSTVKIGTTVRLLERLSNLRTDLQYVVAIERGNFRQEHLRHKQFAEERIGRREDFRLSERLKQHIDELASNRDELVSIATT